MKKNYFILLIILSVGFINELSAQEYPFPQNRTYEYGFMSDHISHEDVRGFYDEWKADYVIDCGANGYRVAGGPGGTVSEGIAYGLLLTAYFGDKEIFDGLWQYYKDNMNANGVMHWQIGGCTGVTSQNGATDAEMDAAMALLVANCQWPNSSSPHNYAEDATTLINNIKEHEFETCAGGLIVQKPGDAWGGCTCTNPSYYATGYYRAFSHFTGDTWWDQAADDAYTAIFRNAHPNTGLVYDWMNAETGGAAGGNGCNPAVGGGGEDYYYDAARTPWRIAVDYMWWGAPDAQEWLQTVTDWVKAPATDQGGWIGGGGIDQIGTGYRHNGEKYENWRNSAFTGAFALASMATSQEDVDTFTDYWMNGPLDDEPYFQNSLRVMYALLATGNFWYPCEDVQCDGPELGPDVSLCGGTGSVMLETNITTSPEITFTWEKDGVEFISNSSTANFIEVDESGIYTVSVDNDGCIRTDEIEVMAILPEVDLGGPYNLCSPSYADLNASVSGEGLKYQWYKDGNLLPDDTLQELEFVRNAGVYRVEVEAEGCESVFGEVEVSSSNAEPVDGCLGSEGSVSLSVIGNGNYNWYASEEGGEPLEEGSDVFSTPEISETTIYYVQDMSSISGNVGPSTAMDGGTQWGCSNQHRLIFTASSNFTLEALKIPLEAYGNGNGTVTIEILDSDNDVMASFTSDPVTHSGGTGNLVRFTFNNGDGVLIDKDSWGENLKMRLQNESCSFNGAPLWNQDVSPAYPFTSVGNIISITGAERSGGTANSSDYMYFYDWEISTGTSCDRIAVVAEIGECEVQPVTLASFNVEDLSAYVLLSWTTVNEINNDFFVIERSFDGRTFEKIGNISGNGSTSELRSYTYKDESQIQGTVYYRLAQYDYDGTVTYSNAVSVIRDDSVVLTISPNPFVENAVLRILSGEQHDVSVRVTDLRGIVLWEENGRSVNEKIYFGQGLKGGVYILQVFLNNTVYTRKVIKE